MIRFSLFFIIAFNILCANKHESMVADLDTIGNSLRCHYAPALWKKQHKGWELEAQLEIAKESIRQNKNLTVPEFQKIIRRFIRSMHDYHCSVRFHSTELAFLPFDVVGADDRYFVVDVKGSANLIKIGEEIVSINDRPVHDLVLEIQREEFGTDGPGTDRALATIFLTKRLASAGTQVPSGSVKVAVRAPSSRRSRTVRMAWAHRPELITHNESVSSIDDDPLNRLMVLPLYQELSQAFAAEDREISKHHLGDRDGFLPNLSKKLLWKTDSECLFRAYLFELDGRKIGYIRIPNYLAGEDNAEEFGDIIAHMQKYSDSLVIDQLNNPGGSVFYLYALASMLTDRPLETPKHSLTITPREVEFAVNTIPALKEIKNDDQARMVLGNTMSGYPVSLHTAQNLLEFCRFLVQEWNANRLLTRPTFLYGVDQIMPHPRVNYTKPILMLINELDFSGGDFMPAILQDNNRAVLMGTRTAGAGGFVAKSSFPNRWGIDQFYYTASIAHRIDHNPIENLGVTPDIPYRMSASDLQGNYQEFIKEILNQVQNLR